VELAERRRIRDCAGSGKLRLRGVQRQRQRHAPKYCENFRAFFTNEKGRQNIAAWAGAGLWNVTNTARRRCVEPADAGTSVRIYLRPGKKIARERTLTPGD